MSDVEASSMSASVRLWKPRGFDAVRLFRADRLRQRFARHTHDEYALGVITQGVLGFDYRGERLLAGRGEINLVVPDEAHTGQPALGQDWSYRMFYVEPALMLELASELRCGRSLPFFRAGVIQNESLATAIIDLHRDLDRELLSNLEAESRITMLLAHWMQRHAERFVAKRVSPRLDLKRVRDFLDERWCDRPTLQSLAALIDVSSFQLLRAFKQQFGVPPHAYLVQRQLKEARRLMEAGWRVIDVAHAAGFADQSHLNRHFKRIVGITPGQYCNFVQASRGR
jgi:AraC-like DNA-binding protein